MLERRAAGAGALGVPGAGWHCLSCAPSSRIRLPLMPPGSSLWGLLPGKSTDTSTKATMGEENTMYYDKKLKRWVDPVRAPASLNSCASRCR
jgi:hypothetical protein